MLVNVRPRNQVLGYFCELVCLQVRLTASVVMVTITTSTLRFPVTESKYYLLFIVITITDLNSTVHEICGASTLGSWYT